MTIVTSDNLLPIGYDAWSQLCLLRQDDLRHRYLDQWPFARHCSANVWVTERCTAAAMSPTVITRPDHDRHPDERSGSARARRATRPRRAPRGPRPPPSRRRRRRVHGASRLPQVHHLDVDAAQRHPDTCSPAANTVWRTRAVAPPGPGRSRAATVSADVVAVAPAPGCSMRQLRARIPSMASTAARRTPWPPRRGRAGWARAASPAAARPRAGSAARRAAPSPARPPEPTAVDPTGSTAMRCTATSSRRGLGVGGRAVRAGPPVLVGRQPLLGAVPHQRGIPAAGQRQLMAPSPTTAMPASPPPAERARGGCGRARPSPRRR